MRIIWNTSESVRTMWNHLDTLDTLIKHIERWSAFDHIYLILWKATTKVTKEQNEVQASEPQSHRIVMDGCSGMIVLRKQRSSSD